MFTRKLGKLVRGDATPYQIVTAAILGSLIAFLPGLDKAPGLYALFVAALLVLNANIAVATLVALPAKLLALASLPLSFALGRLLLDGPAGPLFAALINAPVSAYFGLEHYVTSGGLLLGAGFGGLAGWGAARCLQRMRRQLAELESSSERYREFTSRRWVKLGTLVFLGGGAKRSYADILETRRTRPVRVAGVVAVASLGLMAVLFHGFLGTSYFSSLARRGLERMHGATVDIAGLELDLSGGKLRLDGLAMADREQLELDVFRGLTLEADLRVSDLLRGRVAVERLVIRGASSGEPRAQPGRRVGARAQPREQQTAGADEVTLEQVFEDAQALRARLAGVRRWIERFAPEETEVPGETLSERLARQARELGLAEVVASHLIQGAPRFEIAELVVTDLRLCSLEGEVFTIRATHLSSDPRLASAGPRVEVSSESERFALRLGLGALGGDADPEANAVSLSLRGLEVDQVARGLVVDGRRPVSGGTVDLTLDGSWSAGGVGHLDLPLLVSLHDSTLSIPGQEPTRVAHFELPIGLRGPIDAPSLRVETEQLTAALVAAGKDAMARRVRAEADAQLGALSDEASDRLGAELEAAGVDVAPLGGGVKPKAAGILGGILDGR